MLPALTFKPDQLMSRTSAMREGWFAGLLVWNGIEAVGVGRRLEHRLRAASVGLCAWIATYYDNLVDSDE